MSSYVCQMHTKAHSTIDSYIFQFYPNKWAKQVQLNQLTSYESQWTNRVIPLMTSCVFNLLQTNRPIIPCIRAGPCDINFCVFQFHALKLTHLTINSCASNALQTSGLIRTNGHSIPYKPISPLDKTHLNARIKGVKIPLQTCLFENVHALHPLPRDP